MPAKQNFSPNLFLHVFFMLSGATLACDLGQRTKLFGSRVLLCEMVSETECSRQEDGELNRL